MVADNHVMMVQRMIGSQQLGTGGSSGYQYLRSTCRYYHTIQINHKFCDMTYVITNRFHYLCVCFFFFILFDTIGQRSLQSIFGPIQSVDVPDTARSYSAIDRTNANSFEYRSSAIKPQY